MEPSGCDQRHSGQRQRRTHKIVIGPDALQAVVRFRRIGRPAKIDGSPSPDAGDHQAVEAFVAEVGRGELVERARFGAESVERCGRFHLGIVGVAEHHDRGLRFERHPRAHPRANGRQLPFLPFRLCPDGAQEMDGEKVDLGVALRRGDQQVFAHDFVEVADPAMRGHLPSREAIKHANFLTGRGVFAPGPKPVQFGVGGERGDFRTTADFLERDDLVALQQFAEIGNLALILRSGQPVFVVNFSDVIDRWIEEEVTIQGADLQLDGERERRRDEQKPQLTKDSPGTEHSRFMQLAGIETSPDRICQTMAEQYLRAASVTG